MRKKHHKKRRISGVKRRRHSGMAGAIDTQNILGVVAGAVIAGYLNKLIPATVNDKVVAGGKVALGVVLPMLVKSGKTKQLISGVGSGLIAVGSIDLLKAFGALSGDFDIPIINGDVLAENVLSEDFSERRNDIPVVNGDDMNGEMDMDYLTGTEEDN